MLAQAGLRVLVLEDKDVIGGATRTETPFAKAPHLKTSTGAYLLGLMPPELMQRTGVDIPVLRRDPHYFLPTTDGRYLLLGSDEAAVKRQMESFFSTADFAAHEAMQAELAQLRDGHRGPRGSTSRSPSRRPPSATYAHRSVRRSSTCVASRSRTTSIASRGRAICCARCTPSPTGSPASTARGTRRAPA